MPRILFFLFLIFLAWLAVRVIGGNRRRDDEPPRATPPPVPPPPAIEPITQCAWCGVHVPNVSALSLPDGRIYCSDAHREQARAATTPSDRDRS